MCLTLVCTSEPSGHHCKISTLPPEIEISYLQFTNFIPAIEQIKVGQHPTATLDECLKIESLVFEVEN